MNTGLQDAHALAWRLAALLRREKEEGTYGEGSGGRADGRIEDGRLRDGLLSDYGRERRAVAVSNAALSVRNYRRTLDVARACYLDADHPSLLVAALDSPPLNLLPLEARRATFRGLVRAATAPRPCTTEPMAYKNYKLHRAKACKIEHVSH